MGIKSKASKPLHNKIKHTKDNLVLLHQNIRGLAGKMDEFNCVIACKHINPHLICLSEHHMSDLKLLYSHFPKYIMGSSCAHMTHQGGGVCIYITSDIKFTVIKLTQFCDEKNIEICALKLTVVLCIGCLVVNFEYFINKPEKCKI
jgi:predicted metal-dependent RNase